jgi:formiminotetrahydrofolate cyclodeaminase
MIKLVKQNIAMFLDELASSSPAPGGGSVAALAGAMGAALSSMVCNLTKGKQGYETLKKSERLREDLTELIDRDTEAFNEVMTALKMPKDTEELKAQRKIVIQTAFKHAAEVPLETARKSLQVLDVAYIVAQKGNTNSISDAAVSALMAQSAAQAAILNVRINLGSIKDNQFVQKVRTEIDTILKKTTTKSTMILDIVEQQL